MCAPSTEGSLVGSTKDVSAVTSKLFNFRGRAGLQAGVEVRNEGLYPGSGRPRGLKASFECIERGPKGPLFHGDAKASVGVRGFLGRWNLRNSQAFLGPQPGGNAAVLFGWKSGPLGPRYEQKMMAGFSR